MRRERLATVCARKSPYSSMHAARLRAADVRARTGEKVSPYRCPSCGKFHIGHPPSYAQMVQIARAIRGLDE